MNPRTVRKNLATGPQDPKEPGRHKALVIYALEDELQIKINT